LKAIEGNTASSGFLTKSKPFSKNYYKIIIR
jgi:hypothetical protein